MKAIHGQCHPAAGPDMACLMAWDVRTCEGSLPELPQLSTAHRQLMA
jgi:hypothetical protein